MSGIIGETEYGNPTISNVYAKVTILGNASSYGVGGILGYIYNGTVKNCITELVCDDVTDMRFIGGIVGQLYNPGKLVNCYTIIKGNTFVYGENGSSVIYESSADTTAYGLLTNCAVYTSEEDLYNGLTFSSENGWSSYWTCNDGTLKFGSTTIYSE